MSTEASGTEHVPRPLAAGMEAYRAELAGGAEPDDAVWVALHIALAAAGRPVPGTPRRTRADKRRAGRERGGGSEP